MLYAGWGWFFWPCYGREFRGSMVHQHTVPGTPHYSILLLYDSCLLPLKNPVDCLLD